MKVSTKGRYGLRALVDLAVHENGHPQPLVHIAKRQNISVNYLEQVFASLRKAGIVKSIKGPMGGYMMARKPKDLKVGEILTVLEGRFSITEAEEEDAVDHVQKAIYELVWNRINCQVNEYLDHTSLEELVNEFKKMDAGEAMMYYI